MNIVPGSYCGLTNSECALFRDILKDRPGVGVEIGCMDGFSTAVILECSRLRLTSIDPFIPDSMCPWLLGQEARLRANVATWAKRFRLIRDYSWRVAPAWKLRLDLLFIDGDHRYRSVLRDFEQWTPRLKVAGILAMHDCRAYRPGGHRHHPGPSRVARDRLFGRPAQWEILGETDSLALARKRLTDLGKREGVSSVECGVPAGWRHTDRNERGGLGFTLEFIMIDANVSEVSGASSLTFQSGPKAASGQSQTTGNQSVLSPLGSFDSP